MRAALVGLVITVALGTPASVVAWAPGRDDFVVFELCHAWHIQAAQAAVHRRLDVRLGPFGVFGVGCHRPRTHTVRSWS